MIPTSGPAAREFALRWIDCWNRRDVAAVLAHYDEDVEFASPLIREVGVDGSGWLKGKPRLADYWSRALSRMPDLRLELEDVLEGAGSLTILYRGPRGRAAEAMWPGGGRGLVVRSHVSYATGPDAGRRAIVSACVKGLEKIRQTCDAAIEQLDDASLHLKVNPWQNSVAVIMQHMAGNMTSRFADFLISDGEKGSRDRESEFHDRMLPRGELVALWDRGWSAVFDALGPLADADLGRTVTIRGEPHTVFQAINRQTAHYAFHMGQVLLIAKQIRGSQWRYLTVPPGGSEALNERMRPT